MEIYFDVELRIGKGFKNNQLYGTWLSGKGFMHIKDEKIEGAISEAYIGGNITEEKVTINFYLTKLVPLDEWNNIATAWKLEPKKFTLKFFKDEFELPNIFFIKGDDFGIEFWVKQQEKFPGKKEIINREIASAKKFSMPYINGEL